LREKWKDSRVIVNRKAKVKEIAAEDEVRGLVLDDGSILSASGAFIELVAKGLMELSTALGAAPDDRMRFIQTDKDQRTNVPGIFAAGDICGPSWQEAKAVGEGCVAGIHAAGYAKKLKS
jgi:thioredoxin reductase (NADPH)